MFLIPYKNDYLVSDELLPVQKHQAEEELLQKERVLGALLRLQRDMEGY